MLLPTHLPSGGEAMVIRRIREHVVTHNWFAVAIDFLIVVAGVFLGTQVNNWNQARIERNQGAEYRERLIAEVDSNLTYNQIRRAYWEQVRRHAGAALSQLQQASDDPRRFLIDAYQASQILTSQSKRFTYDELISTGRFEQIGDAKLRNEVSGYYVALQAYGAIFDAVPAYREHLRQTMPSAAQQAVRTQCAEVNYAGPDGFPFARLPQRCSLQLDPATASAAAATVGRSPNIVGDLNRVIADLDVKLSLLRAMDDHSRRVRARISEAS